MSLVESIHSRRQNLWQSLEARAVPDHGINLKPIAKPVGYGVDTRPPCKCCDGYRTKIDALEQELKAAKYETAVLRQREADMSGVPQQPKMGLLFNRVCLSFGMDPDDARMDCRFKDRVIARRVFYYLARELSRKTFHEIALFMKRDHTTIIAGYYAIKKLLENDENLQAKVREISMHFLPQSEAA